MNLWSSIWAWSHYHTAHTRILLMFSTSLFSPNSIPFASWKQTFFLRRKKNRWRKVRWTAIWKNENENELYVCGAVGMHGPLNAHRNRLWCAEFLVCILSSLEMFYNIISTDYCLMRIKKTLKHFQRIEIESASSIYRCISMHFNMHHHIFVSYFTCAATVDAERRRTFKPKWKSCEMKREQAIATHN